MEKENLLEMIPIRKPDIGWEEGEKIVLMVERTTKLDRLAQKLFKVPKYFRVDLDEIGSFVWSKCNGQNNVYDISEHMKEHFGDRVEPVLERLIQYIKILVSNKFITLE